MLTLCFFLVAVLYAAIGFGGGSTYTALLVFWGTPVSAIPVLSLSCNLLVTARGTIGFQQAGWLRRDLLMPLLAGSVPAALAGGFVRLRAPVYMGILGVALVLAGICLFLPSSESEESVKPVSRGKSFALGTGLGLLSGMVGIGGGIFLSPILQLSRWATARESAACASVFIFLNSTAGLCGQLTKPGAGKFLFFYWGLLPAVFLGGLIGHSLLRHSLSTTRIRQGTAVLVLIAGGRLLWNSLG